MMRRLMSKYAGQIVVICWLVTLICGWALGYRTAHSVYQAEIGRLKAEYAQQTAQSERQYAVQLQAALNEQQKWQQYAQQQGVALAQAQQQLDIQAARRQKAIPHVIQQDKASGTDFNGIGTHSLHEYNRAFGYTD